jgi:hypothetical protein
MFDKALSGNGNKVKAKMTKTMRLFGEAFGEAFSIEIYKVVI